LKTNIFPHDDCDICVVGLGATVCPNFSLCELLACVADALKHVCTNVLKQVCMWTTTCFRLNINTTMNNCVLQCRDSVHGTHQQMSAFTICCTISSRFMCNLGLFLVYQDQQIPRSHEHHDVLPKLGDGRSSKIRTSRHQVVTVNQIYDDIL
jgi:hypothetical protein